MPASNFSSVLLPEPLRPTIPKNSPFLTSNEIFFSACCFSYVALPPRKKLITVPLTEVCLSCGSLNILLTLSTAMASSSFMLDILREILRLAAEIRDTGNQYQSHNCKRDKLIPAALKHVVNGGCIVRDRGEARILQGLAHRVNQDQFLQRQVGDFAQRINHGRQIKAGLHEHFPNVADVAELYERGRQKQRRTERKNIHLKQNQRQQ